MSPKKTKDVYTQFLRSANATQSGADVYADVEVKTGASVRAHLGLLIHKILMFWVPASFVNASWVELQVKTVSGDVAGGMTQPQVIYLWEAMCRFATNGGGWQVIEPFEVEFDPPLLYVNDSIWFGIKSNATGVANTCYGRVEYTWKTITDAEYVEALELLR